MNSSEHLRQLRAPGPDHPEANKADCSCPCGGNNKGDGNVVDGVREWIVNPLCAIHSNPKWWHKA